MHKLSLKLFILLLNWSFASDLLAKASHESYPIATNRKSRIVAIIEPADVAFSSIPPKRESRFVNFFEDDPSGILEDLRMKVQNQLDHNENFLYKKADKLIQNDQDTKDLRNTIRRQSLKFMDKKITGEIRAAKEGSDLYTAKQIEKGLRPNATMVLSSRYKLKVRGRPLQGRAILQLLNPFAEVEAQIKLSGKVEINVEREIVLGVRSKVNYNLKKQEYIASLRKDFGRFVYAQISSTQKIQRSIFSEASDRKIEFNFQTGF